MFLWGILRRESRCPEQFLTHLCSTFWDTLQKLLLGPSTKLCATWIHNQWENCLSKVHQHMDLREWEIFVGLNQCFILYCLRSKKKDKKCFCSLFFIQDYLLPSWKCLCYWGTSHSEERHDNDINHMARPPELPHSVRSQMSIYGRFWKRDRDSALRCHHRVPKWLVKICRNW